MNSPSNKSPQLEGGYTMIANELLEAMSLYPFTGGELKVILVIVRSTYGYKRKASNISMNALARKTRMARRYIPTVLKKLRETSIIHVAKLGNKNVLGINKDYSQWKLWINAFPKQPEFTTVVNGSSVKE